MTDPKLRDCYCGIWKSNPDSLRDRGIPEGFCGICDRCGAPGHTRHAPNCMPYTAAWCDRCYRITRWTQPPALWLVYAILVFLSWMLITTLLRR